MEKLLMLAALYQSQKVVVVPGKNHL